MEDLAGFADKLSDEFQALSARYGYIAYVFDNGSGGLGTGFDKNADPGDALVAIERIKERFGLNEGKAT